MSCEKPLCCEGEGRVMKASGSSMASSAISDVNSSSSMSIGSLMFLASSATIDVNLLSSVSAVTAMLRMPFVWAKQRSTLFL